MFSRSTLAAVTLVTLTVLLGTAGTSQAGKVAQSAIVVPARHAYLQLAVDVSRFRPVTVIGFRKSQAGAVRLFIWNDAKKGWSRLALADYQSGAAFGGKPTRLVLVDADETIPPALEALSPAIKETARVSASTIGDLVNKLAPIFNLKESEFRSIAKWNNLTLTDHNADRRKYGRWGRPDGAKNDEAESVEETEEVHQGQQATSMRQSEPMPVTEYDEAAYTEPLPVEETVAPAASELPVSNVVSEQPEVAVDPSNK